MLAHDANFRLKGRLRKTEVSDVSLTNGLAYFVEERAYKEYLASAGDGGGEVGQPFFSPQPSLLTVFIDQQLCFLPRNDQRQQQGGKQPSQHGRRRGLLRPARGRKA